MDPFGRFAAGMIGAYLIGKTIETSAKRFIENPENADFINDLFTNISNDWNGRSDSK